ncbi:hypothetical protein D3C83_276750 [compost metagenome]
MRFAGFSGSESGPARYTGKGDSNFDKSAEFFPKSQIRPTDSAIISLLICGLNKVGVRPW